MSLRLKINLIVGVLTLLFAGTVITLQFRSLRDSVLEEVVAANRVASQLLQRTVWRYAAQGTPTMLGFLHGMGRVRANDITLFDNEGKALYESPPSPYKAGRNAPEWFSHLIGPEPVVQAIAFPDGKLEIRANASRAVLDAWDYFAGLVGVALALLVAVNALVFWLVGRTVRPFAQIVQALNQLQAGRFDASLPALPGREAATIGAAFNRMVSQLQAHIETEKRAVRAERALSDNRELARWIDQRIEQERLMIARELHDELGQSVTAMRSMALSIAKRTETADTEASKAARLIADESSRLYDAMHGIIPRLTPLVLDSFGLTEALTDLAERTRRGHAGLQLDLRVNLVDTPLPADKTLALYRSAQEGLTNALRHGQATHVTLEVKRHDHRVTLSLVDNGRGLPNPASPPTSSANQAGPGGLADAGHGHHGVRWLAERVEGLGGRFRLEPAQPQGARLTIDMPLETS